MRKSNSRLIFVPTVILAVLLLVCGIAFLAQNAFETRRYLRELNAEIAQVSPAANQAAMLDRQIADGLARTRQINSFLSRSNADLDALDELTRILPAPLFASSMTISRGEITIEGQTESAAGLLKIMDSSPLFFGSSFAGGIGHTANGDVFHIVTKRRVVIP
jgi:Tfp pilus assembly protein PilN